MKKILLLGASGLLGQAIQDELKKNLEFELFAPSSQDLDILDFEALKNFFEENSFDFLINCTGYNFVDKAEEDFNECQALNTEAVINLAKFCREFDICLMQFSSDYVFDGKANTSYTEDAKQNPISMYGKSKVLAEEFILANLDKFYLVRTSWLFGPGKDNFVSKILNWAKEGRDLTVVDDQKGKTTYTIDLAHEIPALLESENYGVYHLANEGELTWYDLAKEVLEIAGVEANLKAIKTSDLNLAAPRPEYSPLENTKWKKLRYHKDALKDYLNKLK